MGVSVSSAAALPSDAHCAIGERMSVLHLAHPLAVSTNHVIGYLLGGLRHCQRAFCVQSTVGTARMRSHRHPNCEYIDVFAVLEGSDGKTAWTLAAGAGTGETQTLSTVAHMPNLEGPGTYRLRCPWSTVDSGVEEITATVTNISIRALAVYDVPRALLSTGDTRVSLIDSTYSRIGLLPERAIADSLEAGPKAIMSTISSSWSNHRPQLMSWWTWQSAPITVTATAFGGAGGATDLFDRPIHVRDRRETSAGTRETVDFYVYAWTNGAAVNGEIKITATNPGPGANDTDTSSTFVNTPGWRELSLEIDTTTEASLVIEARVTSPGSVYVCAISAIGSV